VVDGSDACFHMSTQKLELPEIVKLADQNKESKAGAQPAAFKGWKARAPFTNSCISET